MKPYRGTFRVSKLTDGRFVCKGPCVGGRACNLGPTALLTIGGTKTFTFNAIVVDATDTAVVKKMTMFSAILRPTGTVTIA